MKDLYKFLATVIATAPVVSFSQVAVPPLTAQYMPAIESIEARGANMEYARKRLAFLETRVADRNYPMPFKTAQESAECAVRYSFRKQVQDGNVAQAVSEEVEETILKDFCKLPTK